MFTQRKAWLITLGVAGMGFVAIWIVRLYIPLLGPIDPYDARTIWLHALIFLPFVIILGLSLLTMAINKFPKIAAFLGVAGVYTPLTMALVNGMAIIMFSSFLHTEEEEKLLTQFGAGYASYQSNVPFMMPLVPVKGPYLAIVDSRRGPTLVGIYIAGIAIIGGLFVLFT